MDLLPPRSAWRVTHPEAVPGPPRVEGLIEPDVDALPVRIVVQQDDFVTGWDDGAMGFEEDAVWFNGWASSFRLLAKDVRSANHDRIFASRASESWLLHYGFPLRYPTRQVRVRTVVLTSEVRHHREDERRLAEEIRRLWLLGTGRGESEYPPLSLRPGTGAWLVTESLPIESVATLRPIVGRYSRWVDRLLTASYANLPFADGRLAREFERRLAKEER